MYTANDGKKYVMFLLFYASTSNFLCDVYGVIYSIVACFGIFCLSDFLGIIFCSDIITIRGQSFQVGRSLLS